MAKTATQQTTVPATLPTEFHEGIDSIRKMFNTLESGNLAKYYEIGKTVLDMTTDAKYGKPTIKKIVEYFPVAKSAIIPARDFAKRFKQGDFDKLTKLAGPTGNKITWSHVVQAVKIKDDNEMVSMLQKTVKENWDSVKLAKQVRTLNGNSGNPNGGGRPHKQHGSFPDLIDEIQTRMTELSNYLDATLNDSKTVSDLFDKMDTKDTAGIADTVDALELLADQLVVKVTTAATVFTRLKTKLKVEDDTDDEEPTDEQLEDVDDDNA